MAKLHKHSNVYCTDMYLGQENTELQKNIYKILWLCPKDSMVVLPLLADKDDNKSINYVVIAADSVIIWKSDEQNICTIYCKSWIYSKPPGSLMAKIHISRT